MLTTEDFTNWLKGYTSVIQNRPTENQWGLILDKLDLIQSKQIGTGLPVQFLPDPFGYEGININITC
jgi:hypothetical protein